MDSQTRETIMDLFREDSVLHMGHVPRFEGPARQCFREALKEHGTFAKYEYSVSEVMKCMEEQYDG